MKDKILYVLAALSIIGLVLSGFLGYQLLETNKELEQAEIIMKVNAQEFQEFNKELGIAKSQLLANKILADKYRGEVDQFKDELVEKNDKIKKLKLDVSSRDETIAGLQNSSTGSTTVVIKGGKDIKEVCDDEVIAYTWQDNLKRFKLKDPDIAKSGDEVFTYTQYVKVTGLVLRDKSGNLKVKKVKIHEMSRHEGELGEVKYKKVDGGEFTLIDSKFEYTNKEENDRSLLDVVTLRPLALFDTGLRPGLGIELINIGNYLDFVNIGVYGKLAVDLSDPLAGSLQKSTLGIGLNYHIVPPTLPTNFAVGVSLNTPLDNVGQMMVTIDVMVYLTEDLNPFE